jgi:starch phosphorylase
MEFGIHQALKIYSGGLGFLSGSHMRSAYDLKQNVTGVGILWTYGYYDQSRAEDRSMEVKYRRKKYYFLEDLNIKVEVRINSKPVYIKAFLLKAETFGTAPVILLSTDIDENDFLSRTITHRLYDGNEETRIAQEIVLGIGGVKVLEALGKSVDIYHMNEGHSIPLTFNLYSKYRDLDEVKKRVVFTTHTPEKAGNEEHNIYKLHKMGFFDELDLDTVREITKSYEDNFSLTLGALRLCKISNSVSQIHEKVSNRMWADKEDVARITYVTNAQNRRFWADKSMIRALDEHEDYQLIARKKHLKRTLFNIVADQTGKMFDPEVLTIVWARRFAEYKRPGLLKYDFDRFLNLVNREDKPIQVIWAGKPYPGDQNAINIFNELVYLGHNIKRVAVLIRYEIELSMILKKGADIWLNTPRITREASGTSGMSACMNGAVHFSINDGWHPEFAKDGVNSFTIPEVEHTLPIEEQDRLDNKNMMDILEDKIIPLYYDREKEWIEIMKNSMSDVIPAFDSGRMAHEYYQKLYDLDYDSIKNMPR